jgi:cardiolipin synthase
MGKGWRYEMKGENVMTIPNFLSLYRLLMFPVLLVIAFQGAERLFAILLCVNLITDILDGFIARRFNLQTKFGAKLDSLADIGTYILAVFGLCWYKWPEFQPHAYMLYMFLGIYLLSHLVSQIRFRTFPAMHLISIKIGAYMQGTFFFVLFMWEFNYWFYMVTLGYGILSYIEELVLIFIVDEMREDYRGLYQFLKKRKLSGKDK